MTDELKLKTIKAILTSWYESGCDEAEAMEGILLAIDAVADLDVACDGDSCSIS